YKRIHELETQLTEMTKNRDEWKKNTEDITKNRDEWKQNSEKWENQAKEYEKHKEETENKINEILSSHLNITEIENLTTIEKLDTILNTIKQEVKECLKLLEILFQTGDSLMSMLKKLVKFCEEVGITGPVQEILLRCLKKLDPKTQINDPKSFNGNPGYRSMDILVKTCYEKGWVIDSDPEFIGKKFEPDPELSFVRKLMRCHYYMKCLKLLDFQTSDFNPKYDYIDELTKACYDYRPTKNNPKYKDRNYRHKRNISFIKKINRCYFYLINEDHKLKNVETKIDDLITISKPNQQKLWKCLKSLMPQTSDFNPKYDYIDDLTKACYDYGPTKNDPKYKDRNYRHKRKGVETMIDELVKEILNSLKALKEENERLKKQINDKNNENNTLNQQLENCKKEKDPLKNTNDKLKKELEDCDKEKKTLKDKNKNLENENNNLKDELKKCKKKEQTETALREKNKELKELLDKSEQEKELLKKENETLKLGLENCDKFYTVLDKKANIILDNFIVQYETTSDLDSKIDKISIVSLEIKNIH
ncbi:818_t:CDS:2, partial [Racocetra persica]